MLFRGISYLELWQPFCSMECNHLDRGYIKKTKPATMTFFEICYFLFKSFVKVELSYVFTINLFTIAENCTEK